MVAFMRTASANQSAQIRPATRCARLKCSCGTFAVYRWARNGKARVFTCGNYACKRGARSWLIGMDYILGLGLLGAPLRFVRCSKGFMPGGNRRSPV